MIQSKAKDIPKTAAECKEGVIDYLDAAGFTFYAYEINEGFMTAQKGLRLALEQDYLFYNAMWKVAADVYLVYAEYFEV